MKKEQGLLDFIVEKSFSAMEIFYEIIKNSFCFWLYFLRGFGFFTMIPAIESLLFVSQDIVNKDRIKTFQNFKEKYHNTNKKRFLSIICFFFFFYSLIFIFLPIPQHFDTVIAYTLKYILIVASFILSIIFLTLPLLRNSFENINWSFSVYIYLLIREFWWTLILILSLVLIYYLSIKNFIFLILVAPGTIGIVTAYIASKINNNIKQKYFH